MSLVRRDVVAYTSVGKIRLLNEDCATIDDKSIRAEFIEALVLEGSPHLLAVADGMGGHAKGEVASSLVISELRKAVHEITNEASCIDVLRRINRRLYHEMNLELSYIGMGTTIVGTILQPENLLWFNVGDSRGYLFRDQFLQQLTSDHVPKGTTSEDRRITHAITQSLGGMVSQTEISPAVGVVPVLSGDRILLCSDGLTDVINDDRIAQILNDQKSSGDAIKALIEATFAGGAPDNLTIIVADL